MSKISNLINKLGPGLLWAGAAIGVSHLVQSTTAGAHYGLLLLGVVLLANMIKYPFFEFGLRYTCITQENLLAGYKRLGTWAILLFLIITLGTMFTVIAAVIIVTAGLAPHLFGDFFSVNVWCLIIIGICACILAIGQYNSLDYLIKWIILLLVISTITAVAVAFAKMPTSFEHLMPSIQWQQTDIIFLIALLGWMPCPIDAAVWHSLWLEAKGEQQGMFPSLKQARFDFNIAYIGTTFLALCFLALGATVLYGQTTLATDSLGFAEQLINVYTTTLGPWSYYIIAIAAFTTMFSTSLTCLDAFPRTLQHTFELLFEKKYSTYFYWSALGILALGSLAIIFVFTNNMRILVTIATTLSFLTAPVLGVMNYYLATHDRVPKHLQPSMPLRIFTWFGLACLTAVSVWYLFVAV